MTSSNGKFLDYFRAIPVPEDPISMQLLYPNHFLPDLQQLSTVLSRVLNRTTFRLELSRGKELPTDDKGDWYAILAWDHHLLKIMGIGESMPYGPLQSSVQPAFIPGELKAEAQQHQSHALIYYAGSDESLLERHVATAAVAAALAHFDAIVIMNEQARTAVPGFDLIPEEGENLLETLRTLPIPYLYGGYSRLELLEPPGYWVRTFANRHLGLPDLATAINDIQATGEMMTIFSGILGYLLQMKQELAAGDTLDLGNQKFQLRSPVDHEWYLESLGTMLVLDATS